jgi:hypothetical protein
MPITNAALAQQITELVAYWRNRDSEYAAWVSGGATEGPYGDGRFPLTGLYGTVSYLKSPAALEALVEGPVASALAYADAADDSATAAAASAAAAAASVVTASGHATAAQAARDLALSYKTYAASHEANAQAAATAAATSATDAGTAEVAAEAAQAAAEAARDLALAYRDDAANSATAAAASAVAAATFDPANFYTKTAADALFSLIGHTHSYLPLAGGDLTGALRISLTGSHLHLYETDAADPADKGLVEVSGNAVNLYGYDASGPTWKLFLSGNITTGNLVLGNASGGVNVITTGLTVNGQTVWHAGNDGHGSGLDADMVGGVQGPRIVFGQVGLSGANTAPTTQNVYSVPMYKAGFWEANGAAWTPTTEWWWGLTCAHTSNTGSYNYSGQLAIELPGNRIAFRSIISGTPQAWRAIYHTGNCTAGTAAPSGGSDGDIYFQYT